MKGERVRYRQTGEFHFLTFSCYRRRPYLSSAAAMELFEDALERVRLRYLFVVAGYVVMPEHVQLLANEPRRGLLSRSIQALKLSVSMRGRERPFWQAHYYDFNVFARAKFVEKPRYIHRNPVRRGLVTKPEDWKWSSYRHYQTGMRGTVEIESEWTARQRGRQLPEWMRYRQFGFPSPVPKGEGPGAPSTGWNPSWDRGHPPNREKRGALKVKNVVTYSLAFLFAIGTGTLCAQTPKKAAPRFTLTISEYRQDRAPGSYRLRVISTNTSNKPLHLDGCAASRGWYKISVMLNGVPLTEKDEEARHLREVKMRRAWCASASANDLLELGGSLQDILGVTGAFDMSAPGTYEITVGRETDPEHAETSVTVRSNVLTIEVPEPGDTEPK